MPPGVSTNDIPGNEPEERCSTCGIGPCPTPDACLRASADELDGSADVHFIVGTLTSLGLLALAVGAIVVAVVRYFR